MTVEPKLLRAITSGERSVIELNNDQSLDQKGFKERII